MSKRQEGSIMISVVIPVYNAFAHIKACLDSVFRQEGVNFEVIVVDDGSTDDSRALLERNYAGRIRLFQQENKGPAAARNHGITKAGGEYIAFLDADDVWLPHKLNKQLSCLRDNNKIGLCYTDMMHFEDGEKIHHSYLHERDYHYCRSGYIYENLLHECFIFTPTVLVRREVIEDVGLFDESLKVAEDYDLWLRIADCYEIAFVDEPLVVRHRHGGNITLDTSLYLESTTRQMQGLYQHNNESSLRKKIINKRLAAQYFELGYYFCGQGDFSKARKYFFQSLMLKWTVASLKGLGKTFLPVRRHNPA